MEPKQLTQQAAALKLPYSLIIAILTVAAAFLVYTVYWSIVGGVMWFIRLTQTVMYLLSLGQSFSTSTILMYSLGLTQEYSSAIGCMLSILAGIFGFYGAVLYTKNNPRYLEKFRIAVLVEAVFFFLLAPASINHLVGFVLGDGGVFLVGLSYLCQVLLIAVPLLVLSQKLKNPSDTQAAKKWGLLVGSLIIFGLWFKYMFLWADTLVPMGPKTVSAAMWVGSVNSVLTLLVAGAVMAVGCYAFMANKSWGKKAVYVAIVLLGAFFVVYSLVALFVPVYLWFWWLTDVWMLTLPILGVLLLLKKPVV